VRVIRLGEVDLAHALGEGEGYLSVADWRAGHERFWHSADVRSALGDPEFTVSDDTLVVAQTFRLAGGYAFGPDSAPAEGRPDLGSKAAIRANARRPSGRTPQAGTAAGQRNPLAAS
jgi:hypothetical protein